MSGLGAAATTVLLAAAAIAAGALAATRRPAAGPARIRRVLRLEWWPALVAGTGMLVLVELVDLPGGLAVLLGAYALLLAVCLKNLVWTGTPLVAFGLALLILPTIFDGGMPVSRDALASMGSVDPSAALPGERHLEVPSDQLRALGDIVPLPVGWRPVSFGELIVLVGLADVAYHATARRRGRRRSRDRDDGGIDPLAGLVIQLDPLEDEPTVVVLGEASPELEARLRAQAREDAERRRRDQRRELDDRSPPPPGPVIFDIEADLEGLGPGTRDAGQPAERPARARRARSGSGAGRSGGGSSSPSRDL
jgi:hypothetical protein